MCLCLNVYIRYIIAIVLVVQEIKRRQKAARDSQVVMYRKYRVGELPDIQIKHSELIRPFQALAQVTCAATVGS